MRECKIGGYNDEVGQVCAYIYVKGDQYEQSVIPPPRRKEWGRRIWEYRARGGDSPQGQYPLYA
jgi:hypothetical protein